MRVFLTGGTGFLGRSLLSVLLQHGHTVEVLTRKSSLRRVPFHARVRAVIGDVRRQGRWQHHLGTADVVVHLAGIYIERPRRGATFEAVHQHGTRLVLDGMEARDTKGGQRLIYVSCLGTRSPAVSAYHQSKREAEDEIRGSDVRHLIFRSAPFFGPEDRALAALVRMVRHLPSVPMFGDGTHVLQPVAVQNVVEGLAKAVTAPLCGRVEYDIGGPRAYTLAELIDAVAAVLGRAPVKKRPVLETRAYAWVAGLQRFRWFPLDAPLLETLECGVTCNPIHFYRDFCVRPIRLEDTLRSSDVKTHPLPAKASS